MLIVGCGLGREGARRLAKLALTGSDQRVPPDAFLKRRASREVPLTVPPNQIQPAFALPRAENCAALVRLSIPTR
eukprot:3927732-Alexandrium_andersonii.AAC.1